MSVDYRPNYDPADVDSDYGHTGGDITVPTFTANLKPFRFWCQKALPLVYDDSLSYYEVLCKVVKQMNDFLTDLQTATGAIDEFAHQFVINQQFLNEMADQLGQNIEDLETYINERMTDFMTAYTQLQDYVNNYFDNLDVQQEINNKLDEMASDGTFNDLFDPVITAWMTAKTAQIDAAIAGQDAIQAQQNGRISVLEGRMDTFASLPSGSTSGNAELLDIRTNFLGEVYPTAGEAVRASDMITSGFQSISATKLEEWDGNDESSVYDSIQIDIGGYKGGHVVVIGSFKYFQLDLNNTGSCAVYATNTPGEVEDANAVNYLPGTSNSIFTNFTQITTSISGEERLLLQFAIPDDFSYQYLKIGHFEHFEHNPDSGSYTEPLYIVYANSWSKTQVDPTLSVSGEAADAKATGDAISEVNERLSNEIAVLDETSLYDTAYGTNVVFSNSVNDGTVKEIRVVLPVQQIGSGDPSIDNVRGFIPHSEIVIDKHGKNLLPSNAQSGKVYGVTFAVNEDKSITINGTATANINYAVATSRLDLPVGQYYVSTGNAPKHDEYLGLVIDNSSSGTRRYMGVRTTSILTINNSEYISSVYINIQPNITAENETFFPMIRSITDDDAYAPYSHETYSNTFTDGIYGGFYYPIEGKVDPYVTYKVLDGSTRYLCFYGKSNATENDMYYLEDINVDNTLDKYHFDKCSHFKTMRFTDAYSSPNASYSIYPDEVYHTIRIAFPKSMELDTVEKANAWLASQYNNGTPVQICFRNKTNNAIKTVPMTINLTIGKNTLQNSINSMMSVYYTIASDKYLNIVNQYGDVPEYFRQYIADKVTAVKDQMMAVGKNGETFVFITDIHWEDNDKNSPSLLHYLLNKLNIHIVICGGDVINSGTKSAASASMLDCLKSFEHYGNSMFVTFGNHDSNKDNVSDQTQWFTDDNVYALIEKSFDHLVTYFSTFSYYFDVDTTKTRFIVVNTGTDGTYTDYDELVEAFNVTSDYHIVIIAHWLAEGDTKTVFCINLEQLIDAYNGNGTFAIDDKEYTFSGEHGKIVGVHFGHLHRDENWKTQSGTNIMSSDCDNGVRSNSTDTYVPNTITSQAFDVVTYDYINNTINMVRIGRGNNRTFD